jgi:signal transduction histidine kinase
VDNSSVGGLEDRRRASMSMLRRPEPVEVVTLCISIVVVAYSFLEFALVDAAVLPKFPDVVRLGLAATTLCLLTEVFPDKIAYRAAALIVHYVVLVVLLFTFEARFLLLEILCVVVLEIQVSTRISSLRAAALNGLVLASVTLIGLSAGGTMGDRGAVLVCCGVFAFFCGMFTYYREQLVETTNSLAFQTRAVENLAAANRSFVEHMEDVETESTERERLRITRELHDSIGYAMTNMTMMMNASPYLIEQDPPKLLEYCSKTKDLASATLGETREILYRLRAVDNSISSAPSFFFKLCRDFAEATGVRTDCHIGNLAARLPERVFAVLFRAVQVAFINALRHGHAAHIALSFWQTENELRMRVWNNALGEPDGSDVPDEGIGLKGIRERLQALRGQLVVGFVADGFELAVTIPREELEREAN